MNNKWLAPLKPNNLYKNLSFSQQFITFGCIKVDWEDYTHPDCILTSKKPQ
jgi:hypothetical protein